jgi:hypothetical protein
MIESLIQSLISKADSFPVVKRTFGRHPTIKYGYKAVQMYLTFITLQTMFQTVKDKIKLAKMYATIAAIIIALLIVNAVVQTVKIYQLQNTIEQMQTV